MRGFSFIVLAAVAVICLMATTQTAQAQVGVEIGVAPVCPYGYYDVAPYHCAPYGYYGPEWFTGGIFIGAGPWFHGEEHFRGHVDNRFHPDHGYKGRLPERNERAEAGKRFDRIPNFQSSEMRDGRGHRIEK
jgi:hypothetical protein